ncbi:MAG TPA: tetratricopeptide repeat protein [Dehalococcoidia bacterium]|nr:tetratricopeptide repeat protein [Dehalococcoidia bacterium]
MTYQAEDKARVKRVRTEQAIQFAMQSRWDDAITANRAIIAAFPEEADAFNRLGKALAETGKIKEAREAYQKALELEPSNMIARKNLDRLASARAKVEPDRAQQVDTSLFIEEMGKTGVTVLRPANKKMLGTLTAGDEVALKGVGSRLTVETMAGEYISDVEPRLALRLTKLMNGGNKYAAAVASATGDGVRIIIKETFQHPTQVGRLSFPAGKAGDVVRPYTKESMVRADMDDDEDYADETEEWEEADTEPEPDAEPRDVNIFDVARSEDADEPEFEE